VSAILLATRVFFGDDASAAVKRVVREAAPGTVLVVAQDGSREVGSGSGWVIDAKEGLIVTNAHVLNGGNTFRIGLANEFRDARVVGVAPCEDLGLLRVRDTSGLKALPLGSQSSLELGETVIAVGYPGNASGEASLTSTTGVVSVVESAYRESALDVPRYSNVIQTDAAINPGNSGGPLLDLDGRLVGVNSAGRTIARDGRIVQGQNYAIGVDRVKEVTRILRTGRSLGWSGFSFDYPSAAELRRSKRPVGLRINEAVQGTEAARAGLSTKDATLLAVNGFSLDNSLASYCDAVDGIASGEQVRLTVLDRGARKAREITVALE